MDIRIQSRNQSKQRRPSMNLVFVINKRLYPKSLGHSDKYVTGRELDIALYIYDEANLLKNACLQKGKQFHTRQTRCFNTKPVLNKVPIYYSVAA